MPQRQLAAALHSSMWPATASPQGGAAVLSSRRMQRQDAPLGAGSPLLCTEHIALLGVEILNFVALFSWSTMYTLPRLEAATRPPGVMQT